MKENISLDRRGFVKAFGIAAGGVVLVACQKRQPLEETSTQGISACEEVGNYCVVDSAEAGPGGGAPQSCTTTSDGKPVNRTDDRGYCVEGSGE